MFLTLYDILVLLQATANVIVFFCVNVAGVFMHNLMEHAQRKAFLDTRNCIAARLEMEDENEKLVSRVLVKTFPPSVFVARFSVPLCVTRQNVARLKRSNFPDLVFVCVLCVERLKVARL
jgi:hypothetical protein